MTAARHRFAIELTHGDDATATGLWRPTGAELGTAAPMREVPPFLVLEAMARLAGELVRRVGGARFWMLGGVDQAALAPIAVNAPVTLTGEVLRRSARSALVATSAISGGRTAAHARLLLIPLAS